MDKEKIKDFFIELFKFLLSIINYILIVACDPYENYHIFCGTLYLFVLSAAIESLEMMLDGIDKKNKIAFGFSFIAFAVYGSLCIIIGFLFAIDEKNMIGLKLYHFVIYIVVGRLVLFIDILIKIISYEEGLWYVVQGIWDFFMCCCNRLVHRFCHRDPDNISQANKKDGYRKEDKQVGTRGDSNTKGET